MDLETTCMQHVISVPINEYKVLIGKFLEALCAASRPPAFCPRNDIETVDELFQKILEKDQDISVAVEQLRKHQEEQKVIQQYKEKIAKKDKLILNYASKLREAELNIERVLRKHRFHLQGVKQKDKIRIHPRDITAYAHKISGSTSAPTYWKPGFPMYGFSPPAPQEHMMRAGVLSRGVIEDTLIVDDSKASVAYKTKTENEASSETPTVPIGISMPEVDIAKMMPLGWKPGDPIVLPKEGDSESFLKKSPGGIKRHAPEDDDNREPALKRRKVGEEEEESDSESSESDSDNDAKPSVSLSLSSDDSD